MARGRNNNTSTDQTRLQASLIRQKHCAIRPHLPAGLGFRQGQVHSADVILNILARRRDPVALITILTPDALKLQHEPAADCARYDNLRRAG